MAGARRPRHFLLVTYPTQGQINPTINLANRLAEASAAQVTISTSISAHRKMFPGLTRPDQEFTDGGPISYFPFSDGCDDGFRDGVDDLGRFLSQYNTLGSKNLSSVISELGSRGRRVDCVVYTFLQPWAADVARQHGIPSAEYWIQAATVFKIFHETFHGHEDLLASARRQDPSSVVLVGLPGLPPLRVRDLPSFLTAPDPSKDASYAFLYSIRESFLSLDREARRGERRPKVLVSSFDELEGDALSAVKGVDLIAVGSILKAPTAPKKASAAEPAPGRNLFKPDAKAYMWWLDSKPQKSVVYVSFGSIAVLKKQQTEEVLRGLKASGRPFLWVVRRDCMAGGGAEFEEVEAGGDAMVVEWCSQVGVHYYKSLY